MQNTFTRNFSKQSIDAGDYHHIRMVVHPQTAKPDGEELWVVPPLLPPPPPSPGQLPPPAWPNVRSSAYWSMANAKIPSIPRGSHDLSDVQYGWVLDEFSAACWYTAQELSDILYTHNTSDGSGRETFVPIGLVESAWGGTMIEAWTPNATLSASCGNSTGGPPAVAPQGNGGLYNGMVAPYLNM
jgi:hypothetical protein